MKKAFFTYLSLMKYTKYTQNCITFIECPKAGLRSQRILGGISFLRTPGVGVEFFYRTPKVQLNHFYIELLSYGSYLLKFSFTL